MTWAEAQDSDRFSTADGQEILDFAHQLPPGVPETARRRRLPVVVSCTAGHLFIAASSGLAAGWQRSSVRPTVPAGWWS
jgi:hypothetical protein